MSPSPSTPATCSQRSSGPWQAPRPRRTPVPAGPGPARKQICLGIVPSASWQAAENCSSNSFWEGPTSVGPLSRPDWFALQRLGELSSPSATFSAACQVFNGRPFWQAFSLTRACAQNQGLSAIVLGLGYLGGCRPRNHSFCMTGLKAAPPIVPCQYRHDFRSAPAGAVFSIRSRIFGRYMVL